ncbi:Na+/H+ antiporter subunit E [Blastococcus sp. MG754426]|uniref:Na+/H+ antiporter subunit E n=1 Tax=unclassified Blastococcus TaxID=2619396 RepID=UPI001EF0DBC5|nr:MULTISPECIES: Na+/H+ antiporter subunit E [unclassified Blastococcus]MCF6509292.1 Na+/H+ antiporter subunit E [Blastococcus sp. MG754426]MCF6513839.1 Na+/H+ antiporter subunit E [Blastococcus sp. MG754427]MCF6736653.1 Na+/H+ antiporter subunit E [Blastococcus sp. KM273129]
MTGDPAPAATHRLRHQLPLLVWLVLVWNLLWGTWSWANLLGGVVVALAVTLLLPLPPVEGGARVRPIAFVRFLSYFVVDLVSSGALVAWQTVRPSGIDRSAIVTVQLRTDSDLLLTILSESLTLVPGSMVIDLDRERRTLGLHILHVRHEADVERQRASVLAQEERVVRAFGSPDDIAALGLAPGEELPRAGRRTP